MENQNTENLKLQDDALEEVSGGKTGTGVPVDKLCPLCKQFHEVRLKEYATVGYKGKWVRGAMKFICDNSKAPYNYFYELKDGNQTVYLDINFGILS